MNEPSDRIYRNVINLLILFILMGITFYVLFYHQDYHQVWDLVQKASGEYLVLAAVLVFLFLCGEAWIIQLVLHPIVRYIPFFRCLKYTMVGFFYSGITPSASGGQPLQVLYMKQDAIPISASSATMVLITILYKGVLVLLATVIMLFKFSFVEFHAGSFLYLILAGYVCNILFILLLCLLLFSKRASRFIVVFILKLIRRFPSGKRALALEAKALKTLDEYQEGALYIKNHIQVVFRAFFITLAQRLAMFMVPCCIYYSFHMHGYSILDLVSLQTLISVACELIPLPGAVGISETCFMSIYEHIFGSGWLVPAVLLSRTLSFYLPLLICAFVVLYLQLRSFFKNNDRKDDLNDRIL